jgi:hypothetical protein
MRKFYVFKIQNFKFCFKISKQIRVLFKLLNSFKMPQLPWTEDMVVTLLNLVLLKKAHLANGCKGIKEI